MVWGLIVEFLVVCLAGGVIAGIGAGLFGLGGGLTTIPILNYLLPLAAVPSALMMHTALACSMALILVNTSAAALKRWHGGELDLGLLARLAVPLAVGAIVGAAIADLVSTQVLRIFFLLVVLNSIRSSVSAILQGNKERDSQHQPLRRPLAAAVSFVTGIASALGGTGAGTIMVPFLNARGFSMQQAGAQAAGLSCIIGAVGTVTYVIVGANAHGMPPLSLGYLYLPALAGLAIGGVAAAPLGVRLSQRLEERSSHWLFLATLLVILAAMLLKLFGIT